MMYRRKRDLYKRFLDKVYPEPNTGCWIWGGASNKTGYGSMWVYKSTMLAHSVSFQLYNNVIIQSKMDLVLHKCNNTFCVNPAHLYIGTHRDNAVQAYKQGRLFAGFLKKNKPVNQYTLNKELLNTYNSISIAHIITGIPESCIIDVCKGRRKKSGGYLWEYAKI